MPPALPRRRRLLALLPGLVVAGLAGCRVSSVPLWGPARQAEPAGEVRRVLDVPYYDGPGKDDFRHRLDLYLPKGRTDYPVVVLVHGGAWIMGDNRCCGLYPA